LSTKIHALVESLGQLARFTLTPGQEGDINHAHALLQGIQCRAVIADTAFDAAHLRQALRKRRIRAVIPTHPTRKVQHRLNSRLYRDRNLIERLFCRIKHYRRVATRYDKLATRFASFVAIAACMVWLT
jgi:transposase